ncbi:MAG: acyl-CoA thioesterase [Flavobacteriales bacterium]|nr:acyl-CoA thioesterase [Flavobacteriales bacterium]MCZ2443925.1 acyl-CoA thioesterase [Flavobacteriales bacterium]
MQSSKTPKETLAVATKVVLPNDTNPLGNLFGGKLLAWMDEISSISAHRHAQQICVTASVNHVAFKNPIRLADIVTLEAKVTRAFSSSMEVFIDVYVEDFQTHTRTKCNEAIFTFVAVDMKGSPAQVPTIQPETEEEMLRYNGALRRRQLSLILAGKMLANEATELKALFVQS